MAAQARLALICVLSGVLAGCALLTSPAVAVRQGFEGLAPVSISVSVTEGELWVALGISVAWETLLEYFIDDIRVEVR